MMITTEQLLCSDRGFGLTAATPAQRIVCRIIDGLPLGDLAHVPLLHNPGAYSPDIRERAKLEWMIGDAAKLPQTAPTEVYCLFGIRTFKSLLAAAVATRATQVVDVSSLGPGEVPRVPLLALSLDTAAPLLGHVIGRVQASPVLAPLVIGEPTADTITLRHPSGRPIEIKVVAGARAGGSVVARWLGGLVTDEFPRMVGSADGKVINFDHTRDAAIGRLLPGAQLLGIGSTWAPFGPAYTRVQEHWQSPTEDVVVIRGPAPVFYPAHWTPKRCAALERRNPTAYRTDVLGEFADVEEGFVTSSALEVVTRSGPDELPPQKGCRYAAAMDPATRRNAWTLVVVTGEHVPVDPEFPAGDTKLVVKVVLCHEWVPSAAPLDPDDVFRQVAIICKRYDVRSIDTDQYSYDALASVARRHDLRLERNLTPPGRKLELFDQLRTLIATECIELPPDPVLRSDLLSVRRRTTQNGVSIVLPLSGGGRHADYAPALALAVDNAPTGAGDWTMPTSSAASRWATTRGRGFG